MSWRIAFLIMFTNCAWMAPCRLGFVKKLTLFGNTFLLIKARANLIKCATFRPLVNSVKIYVPECLPKLFDNNLMEHQREIVCHSSNNANVFDKHCLCPKRRRTFWAFHAPQTTLSVISASGIYSVSQKMCFFSNANNFFVRSAN